MITISQLSRRVEDYRTLHPKMSDLRDSGTIEQDANVILFTCRDKGQKKNVDAPDEKFSEIVVVKHSNGRTGSFKLLFLEKYTRFENLVSANVEIRKTKEKAIKEVMSHCEDFAD